MPAVEVVDFIHYAVLWRKAGSDRFGKPITSNPVEIRCRWIETRKEKTDAQGNTVTIDAQVYINTDITVGSLMWKGRLSELLGTASPMSGNIMQVISFNRTPDLKGRNHRSMASVSRYMDTLPETV